MLGARKKDNDDDIAELENILRAEPDCPYREQVIRDLEHAMKIRSLIEKVILD